MAVLEIYLSMTVDPISCMVLVKGGVANVCGCLKHLAHSAAHISLAFMQAHASDAPCEGDGFCDSYIDIIWKYTRLKAVIAKIFKLDGC
jgi:hypothetical protein